MRLSIFLCVLLCLSAATVQAQTVRYVTDRLEITVRSGQSTQHQILRMLQSGAVVEVLEENPETRYSRIKTADGVEGWVLTRYLDATPPARDRLAAAEERMKTLETDNRRLESERRTLMAEKTQLQKSLADATRQVEALTEELKGIRRASANAIAIDTENKSLKSRLSTLERDMQSLEQQNEILKDRTARDWFMVGAFVLIIGIVIGIVIPRIRWRRRSGWESL